jgi:hypothetical protein
MSIKCDTCPRCKDVYPGELDRDGFHFCICGMSGNIVYQIPHKIKRASGHGWIHFGIGSCGLYKSVEDALNHMTEPEVRRWREKHGKCT